MAKRRANNEGSVHQRASDGRWAASVSIGDGTRKHFLGRTAGDVRAKMVVFQKAQLDGVAVKDERLSVSAYFTSWLMTARPALRPRTWQRYEQLIRCHVIRALGKMRLARLSPRDVQQVYGQMLARGAAPGTVRQLHAVLHRALKQATLWNLAARNVADAVTAPKPRRLEMETLSPEQARQFLEQVQGERLEALFVLALTTGMRQGELLGLRWGDLDLDSGTLRVQRSLQRTKEGFSFAEPKTGRSRRRIELTERAKLALRRHRVTQAEERLQLGPAWQDPTLVFTNTVGGPLDGTRLLRGSFYPLLERADLPRIRFHDLRHTAATLLLGQGQHPKIVSEMLGHSNISITLDTYSHVTPTMQKQAAAAMDAVLGS